MSNTEIYKNDFILMEYVPEKGMIQHVIHKPIADQMFREALDAGTETLKKQGATKWLSDDRKNGPLSDEFLEWSSTDWQPRTIAAGWKYWAVIVPGEVVSAGTLTPVINALYEHGLTMMVFDDFDKALNWLDSK
jgi:hypothetical protein